MPGCFSLLPRPRFSLRNRPQGSSTSPPPQYSATSTNSSEKGTIDVGETNWKPNTNANANAHLGPSTCQCAAKPTGPHDAWLLPEDSASAPPSYDVKTALAHLYRPEVLETIEEEIEKRSEELRELSLDIHSHPELKFEEKHAHDVMCAFMEKRGWHVTRHYLNLNTAWRASFSHNPSSSDSKNEEPKPEPEHTKPCILGVNSEMDALPGIGHACGHNLIAIVGVGVALAVRAALEKHDVRGEVVLLGTPAEEGGQGKVLLIERGAYKGMDACLMAHPGAGPANIAGTGPCQAVSTINVEYHGHTAHASAAPWEGQNALDAAFLAYAGVSALRQQIHPSQRVHGIVEGRDWAANIIPDYAKMTWLVRAPTWDETLVLRERVANCIKAASLATSTRVNIEFGGYTFDLRQNDVLAENFAAVIQKYGTQTDKPMETALGASTDFGNVTYEVPSIHPFYSIPTKPNGGNHTALFTAAAATEEAHALTLRVIKSLAHTGFRVLDDRAFCEAVRERFEESVPKIQ